MSYKLEKPYTQQEKTDFIFKYNQDCFQEGYNCRIEESETALYALEENELLQGDEVVIDPEYEAKHLEQVKQAKIKENDNLRDIALNRGVEYQNILFDSDTDQKVNLLAITSSMGDEMTIPWYGMNNNVLIATKEDLTNIGNLIVELHTLCWTENARVKGAIEAAETIEEVENIEINYEGEN